MLSNIFAEVTSTLRNYYKEVIVINGSFAGKSPYSCQKLNGKQEVKNKCGLSHILNKDVVFILFCTSRSIQFI